MARLNSGDVIDGNLACCFVIEFANFGFMRHTARTVGRKPPSSPISREKPSDVAMIDGESANENGSSENEPKLSVEIAKNCNSDASPKPNSPPLY
jgi:hypothetical protein